MKVGGLCKMFLKMFFFLSKRKRQIPVACTDEPCFSPGKLSLSQTDRGRLRSMSGSNYLLETIPRRPRETRSPCKPEMVAGGSRSTEQGLVDSASAHGVRILGSWRSYRAGHLFPEAFSRLASGWFRSRL